MNRIWIVKFPSHQTHLIQRADVGCFRPWKAFQQKCIMNAIRSHEVEYNVQSFFRDLPKIRERTFTVRTIKHSFKERRHVAGKLLGRQKEAGGIREEEEKGDWIGVLGIWHRSIDDKVQEALNSPSHAQYKVITESTGVFLMRGRSPRDGGCAGSCRRNSNSRMQTERSKKPRQGGFDSRPGCSQDKRRQEADNKFKRAKKAITVAENKAKNVLRDRRGSG
ncbi:hypothetical protein V8E54_011209 [Elaphomyces granulatus]